VVLPTEASAKPFRLAINKKRGVQGQFSAQGEIKPLWDLLMGSRAQRCRADQRCRASWAAPWLIRA
jgi:hypothetical protein